MKKVLASILLVLYVTASSGIVINLHYCMNKLDSADLGITKTQTCGKCGMEKNDAGKCCHDELKVIKIQDDQKVNNLNYTFTLFKTFANHQSHLFDIASIRISDFSLSNNHSPPLSKQDSYLVNCVFRI